MPNNSKRLVEAITTGNLLEANKIFRREVKVRSVPHIKAAKKRAARDLLKDA